MEKKTTRIDTSGYSCPINLAMVSRKLKGLEIGDTLEVISDEPEFKKQIKTKSSRKKKKQTGDLKTKKLANRLFWGLEPPNPTVIKGKTIDEEEAIVKKQKKAKKWF